MSRAIRGALGGVVLAAASVSTPSAAQPSPAPSSPGEPDPCALDDDCPEDGLCTSRDGECVATPESCRFSEVCEKDGRCGAWEGECVATHASMCQQSLECEGEGDCELDPEKLRCDAGVPYDPSARGLGIALAAVGGAGSLVAIGIAVTSIFERSSDAKTAGGVVAGVASLLAGGAGIGLTIYGNRRVPRESAPTLRVGLGHACMSWTF